MEICPHLASKNQRKVRTIRDFSSLLSSLKVIVKKWMFTTTAYVSLFSSNVEKNKIEISVNIYAMLVNFNIKI